MIASDTSKVKDYRKLLNDEMGARENDGGSAHPSSSTTRQSFVAKDIVSRLICQQIQSGINAQKRNEREHPKGIPGSATQCVLSKRQCGYLVQQPRSHAEPDALRAVTLVQYCRKYVLQRVIAVSNQTEVHRGGRHTKQRNIRDLQLNKQESICSKAPYLMPSP